MKNFNKERIGELVTKGIIFAVGGALAVIVSLADTNSTNDSKHASEGYDDAIDAIMNSNMWSSDRQEAIAAVGHNANIEMYNAVIRIAQDKQMWSSDKVKTIKTIFGN